MLVTINTDASHNSQYNIGAYAFWIVCDQGVIRKRGVLKDKVKGSTHAEFMCIVNALHTVYTSNFTGVNRIIINSDCKPVFTALDGQIKAGSVAAKCYSVLDLLKKKYGIPQAHTLHEFRHVKAHTDAKNARSKVNEWCDVMSRQTMREAVRVKSFEKINK